MERKVAGFYVDIEAIARGLWSMIEPEDHGPLSYGMLPYRLMEPLERITQEKLEAVACKNYGFNSLDELGRAVQKVNDSVGSDFRLDMTQIKKAKAEILRLVSVELLRRAKEAGICLV